MSTSEAQLLLSLPNTDNTSVPIFYAGCLEICASVLRAFS